MKERIGITGSHGFVGERLISYAEQTNKEYIRLGRDSNVPEDIGLVFDLAAYGNRYDHTDSKEIEKANVNRVVDLLKAVQPDTTVVLVSSSSVLLPTQTDYSRTKAQMEELASIWVDQTRNPVIIARPSTITGVGDSETRLIPKLIDAAFTGRTLDFVSEPTHDYLDVSDFISAMFMLSERVKTYKGQVFNVSFGKSLSNHQVKLVVEDVTGRKVNTKEVNTLRIYDTKHWDVPNNKLRMLGWTPRKTLFDSVREMVEDYKQKHGA